jgi:hypothetical protein
MSLVKLSTDSGGSRFFIRPFVSFSAHKFTSSVTSKAFKTIQVEKDQLNPFCMIRICKAFYDTKLNMYNYHMKLVTCFNRQEK